jgi:kumamolisin
LIDSKEALSVSFVLPIDSGRLRADADAMARTPIFARRYYTPAELQQKYPPDPVGVLAVEDFARVHKLNLMDAKPSDRIRQVTVPIGKAIDLFGADLKRLKDHGRVSCGPAGCVSFVSEQCAARIEGTQSALGLEHRFQRAGNSIGEDEPMGAPRQVQPILPPDLNGDNQTIGILEFGDSLSDADLPKVLGIESAIPRVHVVTPKPFVPTRGIEFTREAAVDVQVVRGLLPQASVVFYCLPDTEEGWVIGLKHILFEDSHQPKVLSISWGYPELQPHGSGRQWTAGSIEVIEDLLACSVLLGVTVCCSSGDNGPGGWPPRVTYPASSPYVLSCGGTMFNGQEVVWCNVRGSSGGGVSDIIPRPAWQDPGKIKVTGEDIERPTGSLDGRRVPDVAANAMFSSVNFGYVWGTSVAAPRWAALIAAANQAIERRVNRSAGNITALFYDESSGLQNSLNDIVGGNNAWPPNTGHCYRASCQWDACTGWGSPKAGELIDALVRNASLP